MSKNLTNDDVKKSQQLIIEVPRERSCKKKIFFREHRKKSFKYFLNIYLRIFFLIIVNFDLFSDLLQKWKILEK